MNHDDIVKEVRKIVRKRYTTGGSFGSNNEYQGLCFTYVDIDKIEKDIIAFIVQLYTGTTISDTK